MTNKSNGFEKSPTGSLWLFGPDIRTLVKRFNCSANLWFKQPIEENKPMGIQAEDFTDIHDHAPIMKLGVECKGFENVYDKVLTVSPTGQVRIGWVSRCMTERLWPYYGKHTKTSTLY